MLLVMFTVVLSTAAGIFAEHRVHWAGRAAQGCLGLMLYVLVPFVSYVSFAHLHLSLGAGVGLLLGYCGLGFAAVLTWWLGRGIGTPRPALGGMIVCALLVNTGNLGLPMSVALLGAGALSHAVAYDQVVSSPMLFTVGFAVGAAFGQAERTATRHHVRGFFTRNPPMWASVAGLLVPSDWVPHVLVAAEHKVVDSLLVLGFVAVGVFLSSERREDQAPLLELPSRQVLVALVGRFCVNPVLLGILVLLGVGIPPAYLLQSLMPSGIGCLLVGHAYQLNQRLIATVIVWSTILVMVAATVIYLA
jgi:hypothetical protein